MLAHLLNINDKLNAALHARGQFDLFPKSDIFLHLIICINVQLGLFVVLNSSPTRWSSTLNAQWILEFK